MTRSTRFLAKTLVITLFASIMFNAVIIPNAKQELLFISLFLVAAMSIYRFRVKTVSLIILFTTFLVTLFYLTLGLIRGATSQAVVQTLFIYIFSPILWLLVIDYFWQRYGVDFIIKSLAICAIIACSTVPLFIYLFLNQGPESVAFFGGIPNVNITSSFSGVAMHVSGSFLFLISGFLGGYDVLRSRFFNIIVITALMISVLFTGRTMALISLFLGFAFYLVHFIGQARLKNILALIALIFFMSGALIATFSILDISIIQLLLNHAEKVMGGDSARPEQAFALIEGAEDYFFIGAGHGLGVDYLRSEEFPWRYEAVYLALLYKLGLVGLIVVILPFITCIFYFLHLIYRQRANKYDRFFGVAILAVFLAGFTNPYPEAFSFQWMYLFPIYYFFRTYFWKRKEVSPLYLRRA